MQVSGSAYSVSLFSELLEGKTIKSGAPNTVREATDPANMPISNPRSSAMRAVGSKTEPGLRQVLPSICSRNRVRRSFQSILSSPLRCIKERRQMMMCSQDNLLCRPGGYIVPISAGVFCPAPLGGKTRPMGCTPVKRRLTNRRLSSALPDFERIKPIVKYLCTEDMPAYPQNDHNRVL